ncbi:hypothetical protein A7E78_04095 [Syntrophotalea acetylenivorans]|uniref:DUF2062 domain-containing protein n=2 Tax=Syntrophotalea acetylenivorans TaxID=1842532 RepID=A0A1L3GMC0_9BACT|nr:hypothetical protein A7E78_04095 [Syntrophotalea acetylenivorans]
MYRRWSLMRQLKLNVLRLIRLRAEPNDIAKGFALGIFIGMTPTFGIQMVIAVFLAMLLEENKIAAAVGVWITNPLTAPFIYALEYESGRLLLGLDHAQLPSELTFSALKSLGWEVMLPMASGSLLYGMIASIISYMVMLQAVPVFKTLRIPRWPRRPRKR